MNLPVYEIDGKTFKTVNGLCRYLTRKHAATSIGMIGADRVLKVFKTDTSAPQGQRTACIASYDVSAPEIGKAIQLMARAS